MNVMSSLTSSKKTALLSLAIVSAALATYALPIAVFAQGEGAPSAGPTWHDKHFEGHHWNKDTKSYNDDSGYNYPCETKHGDFYYYYYKGEFYQCDDWKPVAPTQTPY